MSDEAALRRTAEIYALGADRRDTELWRQVMADDIAMTGPGFAFAGIEANLASIALLAQMFKATRHVIHDQDLTITGDVAQGETRCTAEHRMGGTGGADLLLIWAVRYQDCWRRDRGQWKFTRRDLVVDWEERRPVHDAGGQ